MRLAWLTDIHLSFLSSKKVRAFVEQIADTRPDAALLGGDIAESASAHWRMRVRRPQVQRMIEGAAHPDTGE